MIANYDTFVGVYDGCFSDKFCDDLIAYYHWCRKNNRTFDRPEQESIKKDNSCGLNPTSIEEINFDNPNVHGFMSEFNQTFWDVCYADYRKHYSVLDQYDRHTIYTYKIQCTHPGGGYHVWHSEDGAIQFSRRIGVYILYLNDVEDGGETEFLYLSKRVKPKKGRLLIFPPNFPWAHRGNPPLTGDKYIMTGWTEFA